MQKPTKIAFVMDFFCRKEAQSMKKNHKKTAAWILSFAMILGTNAFPSLAQEPTQTQDDLHFAFSDLRGEDYTWLFHNEKLTVNLDTENLEKMDYAVQWEVGVREPGRDDYAEILDYGYSCTDTSITLNGAQLYDRYQGLEEGQWMDVSAKLIIDGEEIAMTAASFDVREPFYNYELYDGDTLLPRYTFYIAHERDVYVEDKTNPYGAHFTFTIDEVRIKDGTGCQDVLTAWENEDESWTLEAKNYGYADVTLLYTDYQGIKQEHTFVLNVANDLYRLYEEYPLGTDQMLPDSEMTIGTSLSYESYDIDTDMHTDTVFLEDYELQLAGEYDESLAEVRITGHDIHVSSKSSCGDTYIPIRALSEGREAVSIMLRVSIVNSFTNLTPSDSGIQASLGLGETLALEEPEVWLYSVDEKGNHIEENVTDQVDFAWDMNSVDENAWEVAENKNGGLQSLIRTGTWYSSVRLAAYWKGTGEEAAARDYYVNDLWYDTDFSWSFGGWDNSRVYTDGGSLKLSLVTNAPLDAEACSVDWQAVVYDENGGEQAADCVELKVGKDGKSIELTGIPGHEWESCNIRAVIRWDNGREAYEIASADTWVEVRSSRYELSGIEYNERAMPRGDGMFFWFTDEEPDTIYIENSSCPDGKEITVRITEFISDNPDVLTIRPNFQNNGITGTLLDAAGVGDARVTLKLEYLGNGTDPDFVPELNLNFHVLESYYAMDAWTEGSHTSFTMLPGNELQIYTQLRCWSFDEETGQPVCTYPEDYDISYVEYDSNVIEVSENGKITAAGRGDSGLRIILSIDGEIVTDAWYNVSVTGAYYVIEAETAYANADGSETALSPKTICYSITKPEGREIASVSYTGEPENEGIITVTEHDDGTVGIRLNDNYTAAQEDEPVYTLVYLRGQLTGEAVDTAEGVAPVTVCIHNGTQTVTAAASCTAAGTKHLVCEKCGREWEETIPASGHSYGSWTITKPATEANEGVSSRVCTKCGHTETKSIPKTTPGPARSSLKKGDTFQVGSLKYKVIKTAASGKGEVSVTGADARPKKLVIPAEVTAASTGEKFMVTSVGKGAFKGQKKLTTATLGKNIRTIQGSAFADCKKLKTLTIKSKALTAVGSKAIWGIQKKAVIKVPSAKLKKYKQLFKKKTGFKKTMKIKK